MGNESYAPYDCAVINDILTRESGRIGGEILKRARETSAWIRMTPTGAFPDGMGVEISNMMFERTFNDTVEDDWVNVTVSDGSDASACLPAVEDVSFGQTLRTYRLQHKAIEGPDLCLNDLRTNWSLTKQVNAAVEQLSQLTQWVWENRYRNEYIRTVRKVIASQNLATSSGDAWLSGQHPTSHLTQPMLDRQYMKLIRDGAGQYAIARAKGRPIFGLITSAETSDSLTFGNSDTREDLHWASPEQNLEPLGVQKAYRGFTHIIDPYPARYNDNGGTLDRVEVWTSSAATKGNKFEVNPDYESAEYEASIIFTPSVLRCLKARPLGSAGSNVRYDARTNMGDFRWLNIPDRKCNPDGDIGFHRGVFMSATEPMHTEHGYAIIHKRCSADLELAACTYS